MKMYEQELKKLDGQQAVLQQQQMMIESTHFDVGVVSGMKDAAKNIETMNKQMDVDDIADVMDQIQEQQDLVKERQDFFIEQADADKDDLMAELDDLEADALEAELDNIPDPTQAYIAPVAQPAAAAASADADEAQQIDKVADLMAM